MNTNVVTIDLNQYTDLIKELEENKNKVVEIRKALGDSLEKTEKNLYEVCQLLRLEFYEHNKYDISNFAKNKGKPIIRDIYKKNILNNMQKGMEKYVSLFDLEDYHNELCEELNEMENNNEDNK